MPSSMTNKRPHESEDHASKDTVTKKAKHDANTNKLSGSKKNKLKHLLQRSKDKQVGGKVEEKNGSKDNGKQVGKKDGVKNVNNKNGSQPSTKSAIQSKPITPTTTTTTNTANTTSTLSKLQQSMAAKLSGAHFRWINEVLYTRRGDESLELFQKNPEYYKIYHEGFRHQVNHWPTNPVDLIISSLKSKPRNTIIADFGCGDAKIAKTLSKKAAPPGPFTIHSFDLCADKEGFVTVADSGDVPLQDSSVDVGVFCLSLMGVDWERFVKEAWRVIKMGGELKVSEVVSRFTDVEAFVVRLAEIGFRLVRKDDSNKMFITFDFVKTKRGEKPTTTSKTTKTKTKPADAKSKKNADKNQEKVLLKPCVYKKR